MQRDLFKFKKLIIGWVWANENNMFCLFHWIISPVLTHWSHLQLFHIPRLAVFVVLLTLCNLGTSSAAAFLAKDTTTNDHSELVDVKTHEAVSTQTTADVFDYARVYNETEGRRLCSSENGKYTCNTPSYLTMPLGVGRKMVQKCQRGLTVDLRRTWHDDSETLIHLCPSVKGTYSGRQARFKNGVTLTISEDGQFYELDGDAFTQDEGDVCDETSDCDTDLDCMDDQAAIASCKGRCDRLRFAASRLQPCYDACVFRSCQVSED
jgi:hypothetical protein